MYSSTTQTQKNTINANILPAFHDLIKSIFPNQSDYVIDSSSNYPQDNEHSNFDYKLHNVITGKPLPSATFNEPLHSINNNNNNNYLIQNYNNNNYQYNNQIIYHPNYKNDNNNLNNNNYSNYNYYYSNTNNPSYNNNHHHQNIYIYNNNQNYIDHNNHFYNNNMNYNYTNEESIITIEDHPNNRYN